MHPILAQKSTKKSAIIQLDIHRHHHTQKKTPVGYYNTPSFLSAGCKKELKGIIIDSRTEKKTKKSEIRVYISYIMIKTNISISAV